MRICPECGAHLDPCEICDCRKNAAPDEQDPEAAQMKIITTIITDGKENVK